MDWILYGIILVSVVATVSIFLYFFQERFLFHPEKLPEDFQFQYENQEVDEYNLTLPDGAIIVIFRSIKLSSFIRACSLAFLLLRLDGMFPPA